MMNIYYQLKNTKFSKTESLVQQYILTHPTKAYNLSPKELAEACHVSNATIYRLCDKLGLSGYSELRLKLTSHLDSYLNENSEFDFDYPVKKYQTQYQIIHNIKTDYEKTLESTASLFDIDELRNAASLLKKASQIDVFTSSGNIYFAQNFQFQMQEIGININVPIDEYQQRLQASLADSSHVAIVISFGGRGILSKIIMDILETNKVPVILISSDSYVPEIKQKHYHLSICSLEDHYNKISSYSTRLSILYILDVLYTVYFEMDYEKNVEKKLKYYESIRGFVKQKK